MGGQVYGQDASPPVILIEGAATQLAPLLKPDGLTVTTARGLAAVLRVGVAGRNQRRQAHHDRAAERVRPAPAPVPAWEMPTVEQLHAVADGLRRLA